MNVYLPSTGFATQGPCADGFHIPTSTEFGALKTAGVTLGAWASNGGNNAKTYLKLPFAGDRNYKTASVESANSQGYYWCSDGSGTTVVTGYGYMIFSNCFDLSALQPGIGASIRPFKDTPVVPNSNWATLYAGTGDAGIFHDTTNGLISISADGTNWITIADKNLGATEVYDTGNVSGTNRGNYYQWGNNYAFSYAGTPTTSSTQVNTTGYGPGNYYTSSTFVLNTKGYWFSDLNKNLRGGETGNVNYMSELKNAYIGEYTVPYLCFTANTANSTVKLTKNGSPTSVTLETSRDGKIWSTYTIGDTITLSNIGDKVYLRNTSTTDTGFSIDGGNRYNFAMTGSIAGSGDITTLLNKNGTNTLSVGCFRQLFYNCASLTTIPEFPATTLAERCYDYIFRGCTGITTPPILPATILADFCYRGMFYDCENLTTAPTLSSTSLAQYCYAYMFYHCRKLTTPPKLPATTLYTRCYSGMFNGCTSIKLSTTQTGAYQTSYRIPTTGTGTTASYALSDMFNSTGGTFTGTPSINTTYYTSNTVV